MSETAGRDRLHSIAEELIHHHALLDYPRDDVRGPADHATWRLTWPQAQDYLRRGRHLTFDCSQSVTEIYRWAKLKDPNGLAYKQPGYTGTMLHHLVTHYTDPARARVGALVVFGPGTGEHVAMVIEPGHDPLLFSHGAAHTAGPIRFSVERTFHHSPATFLAVDKLLTAS
jgi:hypothetical protein